jgi:hypothetical protein
MVSFSTIPSIKPDTKCYRCPENEQKAGNRSYYGWEQIEYVISQVQGSGIRDGRQIESIRSIFAKVCRKKKYRLYTALSEYLTPNGREVLFFGWVPDNYQGRNLEAEPERTSEPATLAGWVE